MGMVKKTCILILFVFVVTFYNNCYNDNEEKLFPVDSSCVIENPVSYKVDINPVFVKNCNYCHNSSTKSGNVITDTYDGLKIIVDNDKLLNVIKHKPGYPQMPKNAAQLDECTIKLLEKWISEGTKN